MTFSLFYFKIFRGFAVPSKEVGCATEGKWQFGHYDEGWGWKMQQPPCDPIQDVLLRLIAKTFHLDKKEEKIELIHAKGDAKAKVINAKGEVVAAKKGIQTIHEHVTFEKHEKEPSAKHPEESSPIYAYFTSIKEIEQQQAAQSQLDQLQIDQPQLDPIQFIKQQQQSNPSLTAIPSISISN